MTRILPSSTSTATESTSENFKCNKTLATFQTYLWLQVKSQKLSFSCHLLRHAMSSYPVYGYVPLAYALPVYPPQAHQPLYPPPVLVSEQWTIPGEPLHSPRHTSGKQRSGPKGFEAYDHPPPQSKPEDLSRTYGPRRICKEQSLDPRKAIEYQDRKQEADEHAYFPDDGTAVLTGSESSGDTLDENRKETKKSTGSQRVHTKGDSSKMGRVQRYIESQPDAANKQAKESSASPAGTEREHKTKQSTWATHAKSDSKRRPEKPAEQAKERTSTSTAGTARARATGHSSSTKPFKRPGESQSRPNITINLQKGSSMKFKCDPKGWEFEITPPGEKSKGHRSKEKAKESSLANRSKEPTEEELPDYYAILGCSMNDDAGSISRQIKKKQAEAHPDRCVKSDTSEQEIAEMTEESGKVNAAADVLRHSLRRWAYDEKWHLVYRKDKHGNTVLR